MVPLVRCALESPGLAGQTRHRCGLHLGAGGMTRLHWPDKPAQTPGLASELSGPPRTRPSHTRGASRLRSVWESTFGNGLKPPTSGWADDGRAATRAATGARGARAAPGQRDSEAGQRVYRLSEARPPLEFMKPFVDQHRDRFGVAMLPASRSWTYVRSAGWVSSLAGLGRLAARSACHCAVIARYSTLPPRVAALRLNSREMVEAARPICAAISRTPSPRARASAISSRSANDRYLPVGNGADGAR